MNYNKQIKAEIQDMVAKFLYYDRKEDENLPAGKIEECIENNTITMYEICSTFNKELFKGIYGRYPIGDNNDNN